MIGNPCMRTVHLNNPTIYVRALNRWLYQRWYLLRQAPCTLNALHCSPELLLFNQTSKMPAGRSCGLYLLSSFSARVKSTKEWLCISCWILRILEEDSTSDKTVTFPVNGFPHTCDFLYSFVKDLFDRSSKNPLKNAGKWGEGGESEGPNQLRLSGYPA